MLIEIAFVSQLNKTKLSNITSNEEATQTIWKFQHLEVN